MTKFKKLLHEVSDIQIEQYFSGDPYFGGVYSRDNLPVQIEHKSYIVNMDSVYGKGTHWVMTTFINPKYVLYFDSFGAPPPQEILKFMLTGKKPILYSDSDFQNIDSDACGWFCVYVIRELQKGLSFNSIIKRHLGKSTAHNEKLLQKFFKKKNII